MTVLILMRMFTVIELSTAIPCWVLIDRWTDRKRMQDRVRIDSPNESALPLSDSKHWFRLHSEKQTVRFRPNPQFKLVAQTYLRVSQARPSLLSNAARAGSPLSKLELRPWIRASRLRRGIAVYALFVLYRLCWRSKLNKTEWSCNLYFGSAVELACCLRHGMHSWSGTSALTCTIRDRRRWRRRLSRIFYIFICSPSGDRRSPEMNYNQSFFSSSFAKLFNMSVTRILPCCRHVWCWWTIWA